MPVNFQFELVNLRLIARSVCFHLVGQVKNESIFLDSQLFHFFVKPSLSITQLLSDFKQIRLVSILCSSSLIIVLILKITKKCGMLSTNGVDKISVLTILDFLISSKSSHFFCVVLQRLPELGRMSILFLSNLFLKSLNFCSVISV